MDGCFQDSDGLGRSANSRRLVLLEEFRAGHEFLDWVCVLSGAQKVELRARTGGATLREVASPGEHPSHLKRRCRCTTLGLPRMGQLLGHVARVIDDESKRSTASENMAAWRIARRLAPSRSFLDACADVCMLAEGLLPSERDILRARLEAGNVAAAAKLVRCSPSTVANVSTQIFAKLGIRLFSQMPRAIAGAIDELNAGGPSRDRDGRA